MIQQKCTVINSIYFPCQRDQNQVQNWQFPPVPGRAGGEEPVLFAWLGPLALPFDAGRDYAIDESSRAPYPIEVLWYAIAHYISNAIGGSCCGDWLRLTPRASSYSVPKVCWKFNDTRFSVAWGQAILVWERLEAVLFKRGVPRLEGAMMADDVAILMMGYALGEVCGATLSVGHDVGRCRRGQGTP